MGQIFVVEEMFPKFHRTYDNLSREHLFIMVVKLGKFSLLVIILMPIFSYNCLKITIQKSSSIGSYKLISNKEELIVIKNVSRCSLVLATTVDQIIDLYIPEKQVLCIIKDEVIQNDCISEAFENLLRLGNRNIITMIPAAQRIEKPHRIVYQKPTIYLLLSLNNLSVIRKSLLSFGEMGATWNPRGLFIGVTKSKEEAVDVMTNCLQKFIYKVVVLIINGSDNIVEAYTWCPYYPVNYCGPPTLDNIIRLGGSIESSKFKKESETEPGMIPKTFGNCPLNVSFTVWEPYVISQPGNYTLGIEVTLLNIIIGKLGFVIKPEYYAHRADRKYSELTIGSILPKRSDLETYDVSVPYIQDTLVWLIPCYANINIFEVVHKLSFSMWGPSLLAIVLAALSLRLSGCRNWILWVWGSFWEQCFDKIPHQTRSIWGFWLFLCLHLSVIYKTALVSQLTADPMYKGEAETQTDLLRTDLKLGFITQAEHWFNREDEIENRILNRYIVCETVLKCYKEIPTGRAVFTNVMLAKYIDTQKNESMLSKVCHLPTSLTYKVVMLFAKGHAAAPKFNKFLRISCEAGLVEHITKGIEDMEVKINMRQMESTVNKVLTIDQVYGAFCILAIGLSIAGISFIWEFFRYSLIEKCAIHLKNLYIFAFKE